MRLAAVAFVSVKLLLGLVLPSIQVFGEDAEVTISLDCAQVRHVMRGGIGASWHAIETPIPVVSGRSHGGSGWGGYPPSEDGRAWRQIYRHAEWLGLDFCRVELEQRIYEPERVASSGDAGERAWR